MLEIVQKNYPFPSFSLMCIFLPTVAGTICAPPSSLKLLHNVLLSPIFFHTGIVPLQSWHRYILKEEFGIFYLTGIILSVHCSQLTLCSKDDIMFVHILHVPDLSYTNYLHQRILSAKYVSLRMF